MLIAVASAAAVAVAAMVIGSRRNAKDKYHLLKGCMERRMKLFDGLADGCFKDWQMCGAWDAADLENKNSMEMGSSPAEYKEMVSLESFWILESVAL
mmetsp:Transcript_5244/g.5985  ORF Transcript_5244/g.5985 Transcript_5244/m.5985 type:complete len:97 (-) Transcript_5244:2131-2421(-)